MEKYIAMVDKHRERILSAFDYIWKNPETGYREWKTHRYLKVQFEEFGYDVVEAGDIPGFYADGATYRIADPESACVDSAKLQFVALRKYLENNAANAKAAVAAYKPTFKTAKEQIEYMDSVDRVFDAVSYDEKGNVSLNLYE